MRACISLALLILALLSAGAHSQPEAQATPVVRDGVIDLGNWDFTRQGNVALNGDWRFFPLAFPKNVGGAGLPPDTSSFEKVPATWGLRVPDDAPGYYGYGTYELTVRLPENRRELGLRIKTISSAFVLTVNGQDIAASGRIGTNAAEAVSRYQPQVLRLPELGDTLVMQVAVSNFDHARGGLWDTISIGRVDALRAERRGSLYIAIGLASAALMIGLYHMCIWLLRPSDLTALVFTLLCVALAVRIGSVNEQFLVDLLPFIGYEKLLRIEYLSLTTLIALAVIFLKLVTEQDFPTTMLVILIGVCMAYAGVVVLMPVVVFTGYLTVIHLLVPVITFVAIRATVKAIRRGVQGIWLYTISCVVLALVTFHDVIVSQFSREPLVDFGVGDNHLVAFGFIAVLFAQAVVLSIRSAGSLRELRVRTQQLSIAKDELDGYAKELETRVHERTAALEEANVQLERLSRIDGLTNLYNRREFDLRLASAWADHMRRQAPLALVLIDVDKFKLYNDRYGHGAGDEALTAVASALQNTVSRPTDMVARYGGEEMVALLPDTDNDGAYNLAEQMRIAVEQLALTHVDSDAGVVTISLGVASLVPQRGNNSAALLKFADRALYQAKDEGRNRVVRGRKVPLVSQI